MCDLCKANTIIYQAKCVNCCARCLRAVPKKRKTQEATLAALCSFRGSPSRIEILEAMNDL